MGYLYMDTMPLFGMRKNYLPISLIVLMLHTIAYCQQRPLGMLVIPSSLATAEKINLNYTSYYTLGYEPLVGDPVMEPGSWDGFTDKIRIWIRMRLSFTRPTKFVIYKEGKGVVKTISGIPDSRVELSALSVHVPVSYKGTVLKTLVFQFGFDNFGNLKAEDELFIPASLLKNYDKVGTATKIAGGTKEEITNIFNGLSFGNVTVSHFGYFKFAEQAKTEAGILNDAELAARKKEADDKKAADDKKRAEDKKKADDELRKKQAADEAEKKKADAKAADEKNSAATRTGAGSTSGTRVTIGASGSGSSSGGSSATGTTGKATPEIGVGPDGKYYRKGADGAYKQVSYEEYQAVKKQNAAAKAGASSAATTTAAEQNAAAGAAAQQKLQSMTDNFINQQKESQRKSDERMALSMQTYYAAEAVRNGKANLANLSSLSGNYSSIEELEAEFNEKYYSINSEVESLNAARDQQLQATYNQLYSDASETDKAVGQAAVAIGGFINGLKADKEKKEAREALQRQRQQAKAEIEAKRRAAMISLRTKFFGEFPDGGVPLSSHKVTVDELYFFSYVCDKDKVGADYAVIAVSNVFPIARYGDGTWPFKTSVVGDIKKTGATGTVTLVGYYADKNMADQMRTSFLNLAEKCKLGTKDIAYKGKKSSGGGGDFWGNSTGKKAVAAGSDSTVIVPAVKKADDFWQTGGAKKEKTDSTKKAVKKDDFWNN